MAEEPKVSPEEGQQSIFEQSAEEPPLDGTSDSDFVYPLLPSNERKFIAYTVKLPAEQLSALNLIWLELKRLYGANSPDKSGMIQQAIEDWIRRWDGPERRQLLDDLLQIRADTRRRQYRKTP